MPVPTVVGTMGPGYDFYGFPGVSGTYAFEYQGVQYAFGAEGGFYSGSPVDGLIHAFKSTDAGNTWAEMDSANVVGNESGTCFCVCRDGSTAYVLYVRTHYDSGSGMVVIDGISTSAFDLNAETWGPVVNHTTDLDFQGRNGSSQNISTQVNLIRRGSGDMVMLYSGPQATSGTGHTIGRVYVATFDGTTLQSTGVMIPGQSGDSFYLSCGGVADGSGQVHIFYQSNDFNDAVDNGFPVTHVTLDGVTFGTPELANTKNGYLWNTVGGVSTPILFQIGTDNCIGFVQLSNDDIFATRQSVRWYYAKIVSGHGAMTWNEQTVSTGVYLNNDINIPYLFGIEPLAMAAVANGKQVMVLWTFTYDTFPDYQSNQNSLGIAGYIIYSTIDYSVSSPQWSVPIIGLEPTLNLPYAQTQQVWSWLMVNSGRSNPVAGVVVSATVNAPGGGDAHPYDGHEVLSFAQLLFVTPQTKLVPLGVIPLPDPKICKSIRQLKPQFQKGFILNCWKDKTRYLP